MLRPPHTSTLFPYTTLFRSESKANAREHKVEDKVEFRQGDVLDIKDLSSASVVTLYMSDDLNLQILDVRSEEHTSELQSPMYLVCRLLLEKKKKNKRIRDQK